ncbi:MAG: uroporphyrinogen decarboxylase family protein [Kiritimatiellia bacterium]|jgi:uroporphyrinogen decarboxylase
MDFQPDHRHFDAVMRNERPARMPLYEHLVNVEFMEKATGRSFGALAQGDAADRDEFFRHYHGFYRDMGYDVVSFEVCLGATMPGGRSALCGGKGDIQTRADFDGYGWREWPERFWAQAGPLFDAAVRTLPPGMKLVGGVGNGVFELAESLVGLECLPFLQVDDPELYADLYAAIGDLMEGVWADFVKRYGRFFAACRFGDDLGFRSSLLTNPSTVRGHILPQYRRVIGAIRAAGLPFLWHSCGCVFEIMEDVIALGIDAKHSNEDPIAPFDRWIRDYGDRIALLGGFDLDVLCTLSEDDVYRKVREDGARFRATAKGYALGSGNSIPAYVPVENYLAMVRAGREIGSGRPPDGGNREARIRPGPMTVQGKREDTTA